MSTIQLEILKLIVSASVPAIIAYFGWQINKNIKLIEQTQWQSRKIIEKRIQIYDEITPHLNSMFCFFFWVGDWKDITPIQMIKLKRLTDKQIHINRHLFPEALFHSYHSFIHTLYATYNGAGEDAKLRTVVFGPDGNRTKDCNYSWDDSWIHLFDAGGSAATRNEIEKTYNALMDEFRSSLGLSGS